MCQFHQTMPTTSSAADAKTQAPTTAAARAFIARRLAQNSWRNLISTRSGAPTFRVASRNACNSNCASCHDSCNAAQRAQVSACSIAAARSMGSISVAALSRSKPSPTASNSSHFISHFPFAALPRGRTLAKCPAPNFPSDLWLISYRAALKRRGTSRNISSFASNSARPRCKRERMVPMGHPIRSEASS